MEKPVDNPQSPSIEVSAHSTPSVDLASLAKLWPNRAHESNWLKDAICSLGFHRWYRIELSGSHAKVNCDFCRWCTKVKMHNIGPAEL